MSQFKGKIVFITFIFTNCPDICPAITYQMNKIAEELGPNFNESVVFLTVTVDPERDTPERLKAFASDYGASWQFLTSDAEYPVGVMSPIWQDYGIYVDIDDIYILQIFSKFLSEISGDNLRRVGFLFFIFEIFCKSFSIFPFS